MERKERKYRGRDLEKVDWTGEISADSSWAVDGAETPPVAQRCSEKPCYGTNGLLEAEHVHADALVRPLGSHATEC